MSLMRPVLVNKIFEKDFARVGKAYAEFQPATLWFCATKKSRGNYTTHLETGKFNTSCTWLAHFKTRHEFVTHFIIKENISDKGQTSITSFLLPFHSLKKLFLNLF